MEPVSNAEREKKITEIRKKLSMHVYECYEDGIEDSIKFLLSEIDRIQVYIPVIDGIEILRKERTDWKEKCQSIQQERDRLIEERDYFRDNRSELFWQTKQQVNTLTEASQIAIYELERLEKNLTIPERGYVRNCYNSIVRTLTESIQEIKESPR
jgi:hypothetical protein